MTRASVHFTITEAHPYHGPDDTVAINPQCPKCRDEACPACGYYKRGEDGTCVSCGADWPLTNENPAAGETATGRDTDAVEPGARVKSRPGSRRGQ